MDLTYSCSSGESGRRGSISDPDVKGHDTLTKKVDQNKWIFSVKDSILTEDNLTLHSIN